MLGMPGRFRMSDDSFPFGGNGGKPRNREDCQGQHHENCSD
jgi:hypothetical protein